jgi:hypothetical protein
MVNMNSAVVSMMYICPNSRHWPPQARQKLNPILMKQATLKNLEADLEAGIEELIETWRSGQRPNLERDLYRLEATATFIITLFKIFKKIKYFHDNNDHKCCFYNIFGSYKHN